MPQTRIDAGPLLGGTGNPEPVHLEFRRGSVRRVSSASPQWLRLYEGQPAGVKHFVIKILHLRKWRKNKRFRRSGRAVDIFRRRAGPGIVWIAGEGGRTRS